MIVNALDLRRGNLVRHEGRLCNVIFWNILKNDRRQFVQLKIKDLQTGRIAEFKEHGDAKWEQLDNSVREITHSYRDSTEEVFYTEDGDEMRCPIEAAKDALQWTCDSYKGLIVEGQLVSVSPPQTVIAVVKETAPPIRGAGSGLKDAVLENGLQLKVGVLVAIGDRVRVDPETMEFKERLQG